MVRFEVRMRLFVAVVGDEIEEELDGVWIAGLVAELVNDDEVEFGETFVKFCIMAGGCRAQGLDEIGHPIEGDFFEEFARLDAEGNGEVGFARAGVAIQKEVVAVVDEDALGEIVHGHRGRGLNFVEIEIGERLEFWEVCGCGAGYRCAIRPARSAMRVAHTPHHAYCGA